jgi:hypothetical protein
VLSITKECGYGCRMRTGGNIGGTGPGKSCKQLG